MISELTTEQWKRVYEEREKWRSIGTCTEPANRETTERVLSEFYRWSGKKTPKYVWYNGPKTCVLSNLDKGHLEGQLEDQLWDQLGDQLWGQLWDQLEAQLWDRDQLWGQLWDQLEAQLEAQLGGQLEAQLGETQKTIWDNRLYGGENAYWVGYYSTCRDVIGVKYTVEQNELLDLWSEFVRSSGWIFPFENICLIAERHKTIRFDDNRRLHCEDGPAIVCRDGHELHSWHGTAVPKEWIEDRKNLDPSTALTWENIEQRRAAAEIIGWERVLNQLPNKLIDANADPQIGELIEVDLPDAPDSRFLRAQCGTRRMFAVPVPFECNTALEANAWTYNVDPELLKRLEVRT